MVMEIERGEDRCFTKLAGGISGCEGPLVTVDGRIFIVEPNAGNVLEIASQCEKRLLANTGGIPTGLQLDKDGFIWVADMARGILRVSVEDGTVEPVVAQFEGRAISGCNDCSFDSAGQLYFTAPGGSSLKDPFGEVFCRAADGTIRKLGGSFAFCNGIAVSGDDRLLIVAETFTKRLWGYRINGPDDVSEPFVFATLPGNHLGGPDGIEFDAEGNLIATNWGAGTLEVYRPDGALCRRVVLPFDKPSNLHFSGPGSPTLLVTEHTNDAIWSVPWECPGQRQYGWPAEDVSVNKLKETK